MEPVSLVCITNIKRFYYLLEILLISGGLQAILAGHFDESIEIRGLQRELVQCLATEFTFASAQTSSYYGNFVSDLVQALSKGFARKSDQ